MLDRGDLQADFLKAPVTLARLEERLRSGYHIFHYLGHGAFSEKRGQAVLYMQNKTGTTHLAKKQKGAAQPATADIWTLVNRKIGSAND